MPFRRLVHLHICGFACMLMRLLACLQSNVPACVSACTLACRQAGTQAGGQTGARICTDLHICGYACTEIGRLADLSACKVKGIFPYPYRFRLWWQLVAASGREWLRSPHVFNGLNALPLHPSGRAKPKARTAGPGPSFFWAAERYRATDALQGR